MKGMLREVNFDKYNPDSEKVDHDHRGAEGLSYSPLVRVTWRSFGMALFVSMGGLIFGYDTGQISGFLEMPDFLERFGQPGGDGTDQAYHFSKVRAGLIVGLLSIGTLIGALVAAPIADRIGRKVSLSFWCLIASIGFVVQIAASTAWYQIVIGRFITGLGVGALSLLVPMYQAETAPPWIRGAMVCTYQLFITFGIFLAACFNYATVTHQGGNSGSWRIVLGLGWVWTLVLGIGILFFPETPRYDYRRGRGERARATLCKVWGASPDHFAIRSQVWEIEEKLAAEGQLSSNPYTEFIGMFRAPRMRYRILLGVVLQALQQLTGANYFFYYGTTIFESVQIDSFVTQIILNTINFLTTFIGLYLVEHYGRRKCLIFGALWMFTCFMIFASVGHFELDQENPRNTPGPGIALIVFASLFILGFATTWGPMVWTIMAEVFPSRYRAKGMALATASNWVFNFLIAFFTPFIVGAIDFRYGYVFAGCNLLAAGVVYFFVIEGQGRTLEAIDTMYLQHISPRKSSKWVPPTAKEMAKMRREAGLELATHSSAENGTAKDVSEHRDV